MTLGQKLKELRKTSLRTQAEVADDAGIARSYLTRLENEYFKNPSASVLLRLAKALQVDPEVLFHAAGFDEREGEASDPLVQLAIYASQELSPESRESVVAFIQFLLHREAKKKARKDLQTEQAQFELD